MYGEYYRVIENFDIAQSSAVTSYLKDVHERVLLGSPFVIRTDEIASEAKTICEGMSQHMAAMKSADDAVRDSPTDVLCIYSHCILWHCEMLRL